MNENINDGEYLFTTKKACCEKWFGFAPDCANFTILIIQITFASGNQSKTFVYGRDLNLTPSTNVVTPSSLMTEMHVAHVQVWEVACDPKLTQRDRGSLGDYKLTNARGSVSKCCSENFFWATNFVNKSSG